MVAGKRHRDEIYDVSGLCSIGRSLGRGRSSLPIGKSVALFAAAPGFTPNGWTAAKGAGGKWTVTLDCVDGGKKTAAQWEYDPQTQQVKYLDPLAKTLSYVPPE